jgi:FkbH-like protein
LLSDPRLQLPVITEEAAARSTLVKAQIERQHLRAQTLDDARYIESLNIQCRIECLTPTSTRLQRVEELFQRTTQFNTTGRRFSATELAALAANPEARVFALDVSDRFGHHGLVGAAIVAGGEIQGLVISCRVLGMGIEHAFLRHVLDTMRSTMKGTSPSLRGQIIPTARNIPVRNLYRDNSFNEGEGSVWECRL